ncbi:GspE/PulE family protein [Vibrio mediterranei]|uniref:GspE/PulE family protein n=1 Tax=Vibrio mediterranei TaxID=689 RepID=UPI00209BFC7B|nr:ATPase, T2SS/T4P/T4SS family [Vibrio mediterranei]
MDETLKSIYYQHQDSVLIEPGDILTCDFDSPAIALLDTYCQDHSELLNGHVGSVSFAEKSVVRGLIDATRIEEDPQNIQSSSDVAKFIKQLFQKAVTLNASDIHIEVYRSETRLLARVDGRLIELQARIPDKDYGMQLFGYLFNDLATDTDGDFYQQNINNGRVLLDLMVQDSQARETKKRETRWRAAYAPCKDDGGKCVLRWLNKEETIPSLDELGLTHGQIEALKAFLHSPSGACIIAGQVGSGKSTLLASCFEAMKGTGRAMHSLEDPIEFDLGVPQTLVINREKDEDGFFTYAKALLRMDIDIEMHGEFREHKGAMSGCRKAETGQLFFTTIHTSSAIGIAHTLNQQMHVPLAVIAAPNLMKVWIYQTLVRVLCPHCKLTWEQRLAKGNAPDELARLTQWRLEEKEAGHDVSTVRYRNPNGCEHCVEGERGRTAVAEILLLDDEDREFILREDYLGWRKALAAKGFKPITDHAKLKIYRGDMDILTAASRIDGLNQPDVSTWYDHILSEQEEQFDDTTATQSPADAV